MDNPWKVDEDEDVDKPFDKEIDNGSEYNGEETYVRIYKVSRKREEQKINQATE